MDAVTDRLFGVMTDIGPKGFKLERREAIPDGQLRHFRIDVTNDIAPQSSLAFTARSKWCRPDTVDPSTYAIGFELVNMTPEVTRVFQRMFAH